MGRQMRIIAGPSAALIAGSCAVAWAAPAWADDLNGTYVVTWSDGSPQSTWTFTPCGPGCAHLTGDNGWTTDAHLANGKWKMGPITLSEGTCTNGITNFTVPETTAATDTIDPATLAGSSVVTYPAGCGQQAGETYVLVLHFTLTKVA
jgi:hypothetical protein